MGAENLSKPVIVAALAVEEAAREKRIEITHDAVLHKLARIGFADMGDYVTISDNGVATPPLRSCVCRMLRWWSWRP